MKLLLNKHIQYTCTNFLHCHCFKYAMHKNDSDVELLIDWLICDEDQLFFWTSFHFSTTNWCSDTLLAKISSLGCLQNRKQHWKVVLFFDLLNIYSISLQYVVAFSGNKTTKKLRERWWIVIITSGFWKFVDFWEMVRALASISR